MLLPLSPSRSSDESFGFSAWETPRLSVLETMDLDGDMGSRSSREHLTKPSGRRKKESCAFSPRSAGSASRPQRSEHISELVRFFKAYEVSPSKPYEFDLQTLESNGRLRQLRQHRPGSEIRDESLSRKTRSPVKKFAPELWNRSVTGLGLKEREKTGSFDETRDLNGARGYGDPRTPVSPLGSEFSLQKRDASGDVDCECVYPGIAVLPSPTDIHPNDLSNLCDFSAISEKNCLDLSSVTLTGDIYRNDVLDWTDTSVGREILSAIEDDSKGSARPSSESQNYDGFQYDRREPATKEAPTREWKPNGDEKSTSHGAEKPYQGTKQTFQIYRQDSILLTRSTSLTSGLHKRHSIASTRESTYIDTQYLPERISSRRARRAGRTDLGRLCCRLSCPDADEYATGYVGMTDTDARSINTQPTTIQPLILKPTEEFASGQVRNGRDSFQDNSSNHTEKYSDTSLLSSTPSSTGDSLLSAMPDSTPSTTVTSPLTWGYAPDPTDDIRTDTGPSNESYNTKASILNQGPGPRAQTQFKPGLKSAPLCADSSESSLEMSQMSGREDRIHALKLRDVAVSRAVLEQQRSDLRSRNIFDSSSLEFGPQSLHADYFSDSSRPSSSNGTLKSTRGGPQLPPQLAIPNVRGDQPTSVNHHKKYTAAPYSIPRDTQGSIFTDHAISDLQFRPQHNAFALLGGAASLPNSPRHSRSFPMTNRRKGPSLLSPRSVAGLRASESMSRPISPSLPSSDDEGVGTRAHSGKSRRSTRSDIRRTRRSTRTNEYTDDTLSNDTSGPLTPREAQQTRPNKTTVNDSLLSPYSPTSFSYCLAPFESGQHQTNREQQQQLQERVIFLERQNKMLHAALVSVIDAGTKYDTHLAHKGFPSPRPGSSLDGMSDEILDMLNLYRRSFESSMTAATLANANRNSNLATFLEAPASTPRLSLQGRVVTRPPSPNISHMEGQKSTLVGGDTLV
ncbi:hypothetical protein FQN57_003668 [Myotisia sp. PD_48]|nr:hypothetical protein FQN57_003668 [Myotisia sp. PD_48]